MPSMIAASGLDSLKAEGTATCLGRHETNRGVCIHMSVCVHARTCVCVLVRLICVCVHVCVGEYGVYVMCEYRVGGCMGESVSECKRDYECPMDVAQAKPLSQDHCPNGMHRLLCPPFPPHVKLHFLDPSPPSPLPLPSPSPPPHVTGACLASEPP